MAFQVIGSTLYVGGASQNGAGFETADYLLACDLINGTPSSTVSTDGDFTGAVYALAADSNGLLYAGGTFSNLDGMATADHVASYDGAWHPVGTAGVSGIVRALATAGTDLYVSTDMLNIDGQANADHIAKWNGSAWSPLGGNTANNNGWFPTSAYIYSIKTSGALVFVAGSFLNANGVAKADNVAYFDGTAWRPIGSDGAGNGPWIGNGLALTVTYGRLYAAGNFTSAGGNTLAKYVASRSLRLVDALIGYYYGSFVGNNVYTANSAVQSRTMSIARGTSQYFPIIIQNEGFVPTTFSLKGTGSATGYTVTFIDHDTSANITTAVRNGTYVSSVRAPGGQLVVRMVVKLSNTAAATGTFVVTSSAGSAYPKDVVRGVVHAT
jgi:hypothetical protein